MMWFVHISVSSDPPPLRSVSLIAKLEFVVSEGGNMGAEPVFDTDQTLNVDAGQLIFESIRLADARTPDLDVRH